MRSEGLLGDNSRVARGILRRKAQLSNLNAQEEVEIFLAKLLYEVPAKTKDDSKSLEKGKFCSKQLTLVTRHSIGAR